MNKMVLVKVLLSKSHHHHHTWVAIVLWIKASGSGTECDP